MAMRFPAKKTAGCPKGNRAISRRGKCHYPPTIRLPWDQNFYHIFLTTVLVSIKHGLRIADCAPGINKGAPGIKRGLGPALTSLVLQITIKIAACLMTNLEKMKPGSFNEVPGD